MKILLVGCGDLGSRHLQGLATCNCDLDITVVDPSLHSLEVTTSRWIQAGGEKSPHHVSWSRSLPLHLSSVDIAIVATPSKGRAELIQKIANALEVRFWVLEKVLTQSKEELKTIRSALSFSEGAWVNTSRRMMPWHQHLKQAFYGNGPLKVTYAAGLWGLACNSIHFIDLVSWWSGESLLSIDSSGLDSQWTDSKRAGYFEVTGELVACFSQGASLRLSSREGARMKPLQVELSDGSTWEVDELKGKGRDSNGVELDGRMEYQSQLSGRLVEDLLLQRGCDLPSFDESSKLHAIFLDAMLRHWNFSQNRNDALVPIT